MLAPPGTGSRSWLPSHLVNEPVLSISRRLTAVHLHAVPFLQCREFTQLPLAMVLRAVYQYGKGAFVLTIREHLQYFLQQLALVPATDAPQLLGRYVHPQSDAGP